MFGVITSRPDYQGMYNQLAKRRQLEKQASDRLIGSLTNAVKLLLGVEADRKAGVSRKILERQRAKAVRVAKKSIS